MCDAKLPKMRFAVIARPPVFGGKLRLHRKMSTHLRS
jgi:hypothetical protein